MRRARGAVSHGRGGGQNAQAVDVSLQPPGEALQLRVLRQQRGDAVLQPALGRDDAVMCLAPLPHIGAALTQLLVDLAAGLPGPLLDLVGRALKHHAQPRQQHVRKTRQETGLGQMPELAGAHIPAVAVLDAAQLALKTVECGARPGHQCQAKLGIQRALAGQQHLLDLGHAVLGAGQVMPELLAQHGKSPRRAQLEQAGVAVIAHSVHCVAQRVTRQTIQHRLQLPQQHRPQGGQPGRAALKVSRFGLQPAAHQFEPGRALATKLAQIRQLLGGLALALGQPAQRCVLQRQHAGIHDAAHHLAALWQQLRQQRRLQRRQPAGGQRGIIALHPGGQRLARRQRKHLRRRHAQCVRRQRALALHLGLDLRGAQQWVGQGVDLVQHHKALNAAVAQMIAPQRQVTAADAGIGRQQKNHRVRRWQQRQGEFGLGADGVQPGCIDHHQAAFEQRVRVVDQRVAPGRHLHPAQCVARRVVLGPVVMPEAQRACLVQRHLHRAHHLLQGQRHRVGIVGQQRQAVPQRGLLAQRGNGEAAAAGADRQQRQRGRLQAVPGQLHRAHRGAARRGRQHPAAGVGKKQRVDQLGFAA